VETSASRAAYLDGSFGSGKRAGCRTRSPGRCATYCSAPNRRQLARGGRPGCSPGCVLTPSDGCCRPVRWSAGSDDDPHWWTWAGYRVNATLKATLSGLADSSQRVSDQSIRLRADLRPDTWPSLVRALEGRLCLPEIDDKALAGLKFSDALPRPLAVATLATRLADLDHAAAVLTEPIRFEH
jgi:hypothetical protein